MYPKACFVFFVLGLALVQAIPAKIEQRSVVDEPSFDKQDLNIEEIGEDKDRAKKSTFCLEIKDRNSQLTQVGPVPTLNLAPQAPVVQTYSIPTSQQQLQTQTYTLPVQSQQVQALNVVQTPPVAAVSQVPTQTYSLPAPQPITSQAYTVPTASQQLQTLSVVQQQPQPAPQQAVVIPQPVQPIHTVQIIQPPQPCPQQPSFNLVQPPVQFVKEIDVNVEPVPEPTTTQAPAEIILPPQKPERIVIPQVEQVDTVYMQEPMMIVPEAQKVASLVKVSHCPLHHGLMQCSCKTEPATRLGNIMVEPMQIMTSKGNVAEMMHKARIVDSHHHHHHHTLMPRNADATEETV